MCKRECEGGGGRPGVSFGRPLLPLVFGKSSVEQEEFFGPTLSSEKKFVAIECETVKKWEEGWLFFIFLFLWMDVFWRWIEV